MTGGSPAAESILGDSPAVRALRKTIGHVATTDARVLIRGESGSGKELVATAIHARRSGRISGVSSRRTRPAQRAAQRPAHPHQLCRGHRPTPRHARPPLPRRRSFRAQCEKEYIELVLRRTNWNVTEAARLLEIQRTHLHQKIAALKINRQ